MPKNWTTQLIDGVTMDAFDYLLGYQDNPEITPLRAKELAISDAIKANMKEMGANNIMEWPSWLTTKGDE